jgi:hypothetical protein
MSFNCFFDCSFLFFPTGDNWEKFQADTMVQPPDCDAAAGACGSTLASLFWLPFMVLCSFLLLSIVVAVVVEAYTMNRQPPEVRQRAPRTAQPLLAATPLPSPACLLSWGGPPLRRGAAGCGAPVRVCPFACVPWVAPALLTAEEPRLLSLQHALRFVGCTPPHPPTHTNTHRPFNLA